MKAAISNTLISENIRRESYQAEYMITEFSKNKNFRMGNFKMTAPTKIYKSLKREKPKFELLNNPDNYKNYMSVYQQAANIGVYTTDLSYSVLNQNNEKVLKYYEAVSQLNSFIGIEMGFDSQDLLLKISDNIQNIDSVEFYLGRMLDKTRGYLEKNQNNEIVLYINVGAWVENMYLMTNIALDDLTNKEIIMQIIGQKLVIEDFIVFFDEMMIKVESFDANLKIQEIKDALIVILNIYESGNIAEGSNISKENLEKLQNEIEIIRNDIITPMSE